MLKSGGFILVGYFYIAVGGGDGDGLHGAKIKRNSGQDAARHLPAVGLTKK